MKRRSFKKLLRGLLCGTGGIVMASAMMMRPASAEGEHYKVFLDLSYSGNVWQTEAANGIKALAETAPYDKEVTFKTVISGTDVQHQISDLQSMIAAGANAILFYPVSGTGLNRVIEQGCSRHVLMVAYDSSVTAPCAYNVNSLGGRYGANSAQWMVNEMGGKGEIVINHGVAGTALTKLMDRQALDVLHKYPGIKIVAEFYGNWNDALSQEELSRTLAAHPNIDAIWTVDGTWGSLQAMMQHRPDKLVVIAGQSNNGYRLAIGDPALQAKGLKGLSASFGPADGAYAFKVMMEILTEKLKPPGHNIAYPLPWVPYSEVKLCTGLSFVNGCNVFPSSQVSPLFIDTALNGELLPELNLTAVENGTPMPGATIQKLPPVQYSDNLPGVNCENCAAPADWLEPNRVTPIPMPK
jgi:ribose transport system substrate-binding protein